VIFSPLTHLIPTTSNEHSATLSDASEETPADDLRFAFEDRTADRSLPTTASKCAYAQRAFAKQGNGVIDDTRPSPVLISPREIITATAISQISELLKLLRASRIAVPGSSLVTRAAATSTTPRMDSPPRGALVMISKNTICLWYDTAALEAATFYADTFPDSSVGNIYHAPADYPSGKEGDVLTVEFTVMGIPCIGINGGPVFPCARTAPKQGSLAPGAYAGASRFRRGRRPVVAC